jgi:hypothetical protein
VERLRQTGGKSRKRRPGGLWGAAARGGTSIRTWIEVQCLWGGSAKAVSRDQSTT